MIKNKNFNYYIREKNMKVNFEKEDALNDKEKGVDLNIFEALS